MTEVAEQPAPRVERVRLFVALELPEPVRVALIGWRDRALRRSRDVRPLDVGSLHVTLCFLGWRAAAEIEAIAAACAELTDEVPPALSLGDPRWLPPRRPRVLAVELLDREAGLTRAQARLSGLLAAGGWYEPEKRPYLPHVTVARVARGGRAPADLPPPPAAPQFRAPRVTLFRSRLHPSGARYEPLATVELAGRAPASPRMAATFTAPLISAEQLVQLLASSPDERPTVLDVRWQLATGADRAAYLEAHIPGAAFVDLDRQLSDPPSELGRHPLPSPERFAAEMRELGVSESRPVVVYDASDATAAARAWWLLRYFGHPRVAVLDGGLAGWAGADQPLEAGAPPSGPGDFVARPGGMPVVSAEEAAAIAAQGVLLDARAEERFRGHVEPVDPVAGHIPGARNRPTTENVDSDGRFRDPLGLRAEFEQLGVKDGAPLAAYCGSGITAAHELLAMTLAGFPAALYPGSWSEWITDPDRPVARD